MTSRRRVSTWVQMLCLAIVARGVGAGPRAHAQPPGVTPQAQAQPSPSPSSSSPPASSAFAPGATPAEAPALPDPAAEVPPAEPPPPPPVPPSPSRRPAVDTEVPQTARSSPAKRGPSGLAIELQSAGLLSGTLQGGIMLGYAADFIVVGLGMNYSRFAMKQGANVMMFPEFEQKGSGVDLGPAVRFRVAATDDRKLELIGALDFRVQRATVTSSPPELGVPEAKLSGYLLALGPGIRYWVHRHLAIGYLARLTYSALDGQQSLRTLIDTGLQPMPDGSSDVDIDSFVFVGSFQALAVF